MLRILRFSVRRAYPAMSCKTMRPSALEIELTGHCLHLPAFRLLREIRNAGVQWRSVPLSPPRARRIRKTERNQNVYMVQPAALV